MQSELEKLEQAARDFTFANDSEIDPRRLRAVIDCLEGKFCSVVARTPTDASTTAVSWVASAQRVVGHST